VSKNQTKRCHLVKRVSIFHKISH